MVNKTNIHSIIIKHFKELFYFLIILFILLSTQFVFADTTFCDDSTGDPCGCTGRAGNGYWQYCCNPTRDSDGDGTPDTDFNMCCTERGCPSSLCDRIDFYPLNCSPEGWTCCIDDDCNSWCSQALYNNRDTCGWCYDDGGGNPSCDAFPNAPTLSSPNDGASFNDPSKVTFTWTHDGNWGANCSGQNFRVQIDTENTFTTPFFTESLNLPITQFTWDLNFCYGGTFYWRVGAANENGYTWSTGRSLNVNFFQPSATMGEPDDGEILWTNSSIFYIEGQGNDSSANGSGHSLNRLEYWRREDTDLDGTFGEPGEPSWTEITTGWPDPGRIPCNDTSPCWSAPPGFGYYKNWAPAHADEGYWQVITNAISNDFACDTPISKCTGNPEVGSYPNWSDCSSSGADESNICVIRPPTAAMNSPANDAVLFPNVSADISATATDLGNNLSAMSLWVALDNGDGTYGPAQQVGGSQVCTGGVPNCTITRPWIPTPADAGNWFIAYGRARDQMGAAGRCDNWCPGCISACSGHPLGQTGYLDCGGDDWRRFRVCGTPPSAPQGPPTPADPSYNLLYSPPSQMINLSWTAPASWGDACSGNVQQYRVYYKSVPKGTNPNDCDNPAIYDPNSFGEIVVGGCHNNPATNCSPDAFSSNAAYCWFVTAWNGESESNKSLSQKWYFETENPIVHLNWTTGVGGSVYAASMTQGFPDSGLGVWEPSYVAYEQNTSANVSLISSGDVDIEYMGGDDDTKYSESQLWAEGAGFTQSWPTSPAYEGTPPSDATLLNEDCPNIFIGTTDKLDPGIAYRMDDACATQAFNEVVNQPNGYQLSNPGVAVVYITGTGDFNINNKFTTNNDNFRVVFVTGPDVDVQISRDLYNAIQPIPNFTSESLIEASFVVTKDITYEGTDDIYANPDESIVVDGPVITKSATLNRNRGDNNGYPSEIFKYSPIYMYELTKTERDSTDGANKTGLFTTDIVWTEIN